MPSDPPTPAQWNLHGWLAAYQAAQRGVPIPTLPTVPVKKEEPVPDTMEGGWRFEGKEKPETPVICTKCQWSRRTEDSVEPDRGSWCESCIAGKEGPGTPPDKSYRPPKVQESTSLNKTFFG